MSGYLPLLEFTRYTKVASATWLLLEIFYTLPDEIAFVWSTKLSLVNTVYVLNKYSTIGDTTLDLVLVFATYDSESCVSTWEVFAYWYMVGTLASEFVIIAMSFALWEFNKYAVWLVVCGGLELIGFAVVTIYETSESLHFPSSPDPAMPCFPDDFSLWPGFLCVGIGETAIGALTFLRWYAERPVDLHGNGSSLFHTMYRDGVLFHVIVKAMSIGNIMAMFFAPSGLSSFLRMPLRVARSTLSTRVLLNLRRTAAAKWHGGINIVSDSTAMSLVSGMASLPSGHEEVPYDTALGLEDRGL
ncbi:hypothetical protein V8D89_011604 [Ganoderma adspersum]